MRLVGPLLVWALLGSAPTLKKPLPPAEKLETGNVAKDNTCCGYPLGEFRLTFYWVAQESDYLFEDSDTMVYTQWGFPMGTFPKRFVEEMTMEGTALLADGRIVNFDGRCRYGTGYCFDSLPRDDHPLGRGVSNRPLEPFRSVAVDARIIPIGEAIYVPELDGIVLPDGSFHDGCVRADDQGGSIKELKMDLFVASRDVHVWIANQLWWRLKVTPHLEESKCGYLVDG